MKLTRLLRLMPLIIYCSSVLTVELWAATSEWVMYSAELCLQVKVVIEAKKEEKSGDIRWGHDHRESDTTRQLHIVSIPNSSQEEHLVIFSNVISWFSSKVHKQSVVMNFVLDENDLEVNLLWVLSFPIRKLALSFSRPTRSSLMTTACDTKHNLCRLVKSMIIRDGSLAAGDHVSSFSHLISSLYSSKIKACEVITSFIELYLISLTFQLHSVGDETRIWAKLGPKYRVMIWISTSFFKINFFSYGFSGCWLVVWKTFCYWRNPVIDDGSECHYLEISSIWFFKWNYEP